MRWIFLINAQRVILKLRCGVKKFSLFQINFLWEFVCWSSSSMRLATFFTKMVRCSLFFNIFGLRSLSLMNKFIFLLLDHILFFAVIDVSLRSFLWEFTVAKRAQNMRISSSSFIYTSVVKIRAFQHFLLRRQTTTQVVFGAWRSSLRHGDSLRCHFFDCCQLLGFCKIWRKHDLTLGASLRSLRDRFEWSRQCRSWLYLLHSIQSRVRMSIKWSYWRFFSWKSASSIHIGYRACV